MRVLTRRIKGKTARSRTRHTPDSTWGQRSPEKIEEYLIEASQRIVAADRAMVDTLQAVRKDDRGRTKTNVKYLERLLAEASKYVDRANQEIGF